MKFICLYLLLTLGVGDMQPKLKANRHSCSLNYQKWIVKERGRAAQNALPNPLLGDKSEYDANESLSFSLTLFHGSKFCQLDLAKRPIEVPFSTTLFVGLAFHPFFLYGSTKLFPVIEKSLPAFLKGFIEPQPTAKEVGLLFLTAKAKGTLFHFHWNEVEGKRNYQSVESHLHLISTPYWRHLGISEWHSSFFKSLQPVSGTDGGFYLFRYGLTLGKGAIYGKFSHILTNKNATSADKSLFQTSLHIKLAPKSLKQRQPIDFSFAAPFIEKFETLEGVF